MLSQVRRSVGGIVRQRFPEIVDPVRLAGGHDVVIDGPHFRAGVGVFDESESCHYWRSSAEKFGLALLHLFGSQVFLAGADGPIDAEGIAHLAVAVAPELVAERHGDLAARGYRLVEQAHRRPAHKVQVEGQAALGERRQMELGAKSSANIRHGVADPSRACISLPPGPGERVISTALKAFFRKSMYAAAPL